VQFLYDTYQQFALQIGLGVQAWEWRRPRVGGKRMKETRSVSALNGASLRRSDPLDRFFCYVEKRELAG